MSLQVLPIGMMWRFGLPIVTEPENCANPSEMMMVWCLLLLGQKDGFDRYDIKKVIILPVLPTGTE